MVCTGPTSAPRVGCGAAARTNEGWNLLRGDGGVLDGTPWVTGRLAPEGRVAVASGALADFAGQIGFGGIDEPWWTALGERPRQPVGWIFVALAVVLVLPATGRRLRSWRIMGRRT